MTSDQIDSDPTRPGEPFPLGAHAPDAEPERGDVPPGMPHLPDDLDVELASYMDDTFGSNYTGYGTIRAISRADNANVQVARRGGINPEVKARTVREALLVTIQQGAHEADVAAKHWAEGVRAQQEGREAFVAAKRRREDAEEALRALNLWTEADDDPDPEPEDGEAGTKRIPDAQIL